jgi:hypothetical protein
MSLGPVLRSFLLARESLLFAAQIAPCTLHELWVVSLAAVALDRNVSEADGCSKDNREPSGRRW